MASETGPCICACITNDRNVYTRKDNRDSLLQTASTITEGLIEARQTLAAQVKRNEEAMHVLGKWWYKT